MDELHGEWLINQKLNAIERDTDEWIGWWIVKDKWMRRIPMEKQIG